MAKKNQKITGGTEQAILEAAENEFSEKGYAGAKTTDIAAQAGITHTMLHYYYRTKENLFNKVFEQQLKIMVGLLSKFAFDENLTFAEKIKKTMNIHYDILMNNPKLPRFIINEVISRPERLEAAKKIVLKNLTDIMERLQADIDKEAKKGRIRRVNAIDIFIDAIALNAFPFIVKPIIESYVSPVYGGTKKFFEERSKENIELIMSRVSTPGKKTNKK